MTSHLRLTVSFSANTFEPETAAMSPTLIYLQHEAPHYPIGVKIGISPLGGTNVLHVPGSNLVQVVVYAPLQTTSSILLACVYLCRASFCSSAGAHQSLTASQLSLQTRLHNKIYDIGCVWPFGVYFALCYEELRSWGDRCCQYLTCCWRDSTEGTRATRISNGNSGKWRVQRAARQDASAMQRQ